MSFPQFAKERSSSLSAWSTLSSGKATPRSFPILVYSYQDDGDGNYYYNPLNYCVYGPTSVNTCASDLSKILDEYIHPQVIDRRSLP